MLRSKRIFVVFRNNITMSSSNVFVPRVNPVTGQSEWIAQNEKYDYYQEIARSAYADMLHDTERNKKYETALKKAIDCMHSRGKRAHVLDIGTGTGLLSMMAARAGAETVTACEAFYPMAKCAKEVMKTNGFGEKIRLIPKRSTEITVGPDGDMDHRANILVTEVFDTELIGEGGLGTFHHAHQVLLEDDCIVVPTSANVYAQVVHSDFVRKWNTIQPLDIPGHMTLQPPQEIAKYDGTASLHDLQLDQISCDLFQPITNPFCLFRFDFSGKSKIEFKRSASKLIEAISSGRCDAVFMWWDLQMDLDGDVLLSCAPRWAHPEPLAMQWRDHWMQAIFYPPHSCRIEKGEQVMIHSIHDEYSWWFDVKSQNSMNNLCKEIPAGSSGLHLVCSRPRLGMLNDTQRNEAFIGALRKVIKKDSICLCISDSSQLPMIAAALGARKVFVSETSSASRTLTRDYVKTNNLEHVVEVLDSNPGDITDKDLGGNKITVCIAEPYFFTSLLHWHNLYFWYSWSHLSDLMAPDVTIVPRRTVLRGVVMEFDHLWKIRAPVGDCEGFDLGQFDVLIEKACDISDDNVEPQPLWEYPGSALSTPFTLLELDITQPVTQLTQPVRNEGVVELQGSGRACHGVAVWMEYELDNDHTVSTGPRGHSVQPGVKVQWDYYTRQGVHLFKTPVFLKETSKLKVDFRATFNPSDGDVKLGFTVR